MRIADGASAVRSATACLTTAAVCAVFVGVLPASAQAVPGIERPFGPLIAGGQAWWGLQGEAPRTLTAPRASRGDKRLALQPPQVAVSGSGTLIAGRDGSALVWGAPLRRDLRVVPQFIVGGGRCSWRATGIPDDSLPRREAPTLALTDNALILAPANTCRERQPRRRPILVLDLRSGAWRILRWVTAPEGVTLSARGQWLAIGIKRASEGEGNEAGADVAEVIVVNLHAARVSQRVRVPGYEQNTVFAITAYGALLSTMHGVLMEYSAEDSKGLPLAHEVVPGVSVSGDRVAYDQRQADGEYVLMTRSLRTGQADPIVGLGPEWPNGFALSGNLVAWVEPEGLVHEAPTASNPCGEFSLLPPRLHMLDLAQQRTFVPFTPGPSGPLPSGCPLPP